MQIDQFPTKTSRRALILLTAVHLAYREVHMNIRELEKNDGSGYLELMLKLDHETAFMLYEPGERKTAPDDMSERIQSVIDRGGVIYAVDKNDSLLGFISADRGFANRIRHSAYIVMGVLKKVSGQGLGSRLLETVDRWAKHNGVIKLELTVMTQNDRAFRLYRKAGYEIEGTKKASVMVDGLLYDEFYMGKVLE